MGTVELRSRDRRIMLPLPEPFRLTIEVGWRSFRVDKEGSTRAAVITKYNADCELKTPPDPSPFAGQVSIEILA